MLCRDENFRQFLSEHLVGHELTEDQAASALCKQCNIESRSELNGNAMARAMFDEIVTHFENWKRNDDPF